MGEGLGLGEVWVGEGLGLGEVGDGDGDGELPTSAGQFTGCCEGHDRALPVETCVSVWLELTQAYTVPGEPDADSAGTARTARTAAAAMAEGIRTRFTAWPPSPRSGHG